MNRKALVTLLVVEIVICFALPLYLLFWGVVSFPVWLSVVERGGRYALWNLFDTVAGCVGVVGLVSLIRFCVSYEKKPLSPKLIGIAALFGLVALWGSASDHFRSFSLDPFVVLVAVLPTLCTVHLLVIGFKRQIANKVAPRVSASDA